MSENHETFIAMTGWELIGASFSDPNYTVSL